MIERLFAKLAKHFINSFIKYLLRTYSVPGIWHILSNELPQTALPVSPMVPILQMKKPKQERLSDWSRVTRLLSSRSRTHTPGCLSPELRLFGVDYPASLLPLDSLSSCVSLGKCLCLADKRVLIGKKGTLSCPQHKLGGSN